MNRKIIYEDLLDEEFDLINELIFALHWCTESNFVAKQVMKKIIKLNNHIREINSYDGT